MSTQVFTELASEFTQVGIDVSLSVTGLATMLKIHPEDLSEIAKDLGHIVISTLIEYETSVGTTYIWSDALLSDAVLDVVVAICQMDEAYPEEYTELARRWVRMFSTTHGYSGFVLYISGLEIVA